MADSTPDWLPSPPAKLLAIAPLAVSKADAGRALGGLSTRTIGNLIRTGQLRSVQIGRRRLIPVAALAELVAARETGGAGGA